MSLPYSPQTWNNDASGGTPLSAPRLNHIEAGIAEVSEAFVETIGAAANAYIGTFETTSSTTYGNLATVGPQLPVTIGPNGAALVIVSGYVQPEPPFYAAIGVEITGPTNLAASDQRAFMWRQGSGVTGDYFVQGSYSWVQTGLAAGNYTFTCRYKTTGGSAEFARRSLTVIPL